MLTKDQTVLVTGGASGIGLALAKRFLARGGTVIICGRDREKLADAKAQNRGLITIRADLVDTNERVKLFASVTRDFPLLSIVVNNAGIQNHLPPLFEQTDFTPHVTEIATNLAAPIHLSMLALTFLTNKPNATIINVTSGLAFVPMARFPTYCATKAALHSFTETLRVQAGPLGVRVVELAPPAVQTDLGGKGLHDFGEPVDAYADDAMTCLEAGKLEAGYKLSEVARTADPAARAAIFARINGSH